MIGPLEIGSAGRQGAGYLAVGFASVAIDFVVFVALHQVLGFGVEAANAIAMSLSMIFNYSVNRSAVFKSASSPLRSAILYLALFLLNMFISTYAIAGLVGIGLNPALAKLAMQACVACWNFFLYRYVVFK